MDSLRIRKLTPKECFRLQGFDDSDFKKAEAVNSNTQLYKQAGNSICVPVVEHIISTLFDSGALVKEKENEMELRVNEVQLPEAISFNYEELKKELTEKVSMYESLVYTDEQIKDAKEDRAKLNKLKKTLNDERIRMEKEYMKPFDDFKSKLNEIISIIDKPVGVIDKQVKAYEEQKKQEKLESIKELWASMEHPEELTFNKVFQDKFLNASTSMKVVKQYFEDAVTRFNRDMETLASLPEFGFEAMEVYKSTLDINQALNEGKRLSDIQKRKAEHEEEQARLKEEASKARIVKPEPEPQPAQENFINPPVEDAPAKQWVKFQALMTTKDALALRDFFNTRNIEFKAI